MQERKRQTLCVCTGVVRYGCQPLKDSSFRRVCSGLARALMED